MNPKIKDVIALLFALIIAVMSHAQNVVILDTNGTEPLQKGLWSDSSFSVRGKIEGKDSGTLVLLSYNRQHLADIPLRHGQFFFSGSTKMLEQVGISIMGDYNRYAFYVQPGEIKIDWRFRERFTVTGTKENDLSTYFCDTLNHGFIQFGDIGRKIDSAMKIGDLDLYLSLLDSFTLAEKHFFANVEEIIKRKGASYFLLPFVNFYPISYGYFKERRQIFNQFPELVRNSVMGRSTLNLLNEMEEKKIARKEVPAQPFTLLDANNVPVSLAGFAGSTVLLDFWASWCAPCLKSVPLLKKLKLNNVSKDVVFLSISIDKNVKDWREKDKLIGLPWSSVLADPTVINNYKVDAVPVYIVIDKAGMIISRSGSLADVYLALMKVKE